MSNRRILPYIMIFAAGVIWGGTFSLALAATSEGTHPITLTAWQAALGAIIFAGVCLSIRVPPFSLSNIGKYAVIGVVGVVAPNILYYTAAPHLSAGILSVTVSTVPLFTYLIMWLMGFEPPVVKRACGIVLGMMAILLLVIPDQGLSGSDANYWILLVVLCAILYAIENVYISEGVSGDISIFEMLSGSMILSVCFLIPVTAWMGVGEPVSWIFTSSGWAIAAIAVSSGIAYSMFFYTIRIAGPVFASQCAYIVTIAGVLWGIVIFSERHTIWLWMSMIVVMSGIALVTPKEKSGDDMVTLKLKPADKISHPGD